MEEIVVNDAPHQLPHVTQDQSFVLVDDVGTLNAHERHAILLPELDTVVGVFDLLEPGQRALVRRDADLDLFLFAVLVDVESRLGRGRGTALGLGDATPDHDARVDPVERLEEDETVAQVLEQVEDGGIDAERVEPEREHARLALALGVEVLDRTVILRLLLVERLEAGMCVEEVRYERKVQPRVSGHEGRRREVFAAADLRRILQDLLRALAEVARLERGARAVVGLELVQQDRVVLAIGDIFAEVVNPVKPRVSDCPSSCNGLSIPPVPPRLLQVIVEPSQEDLIRRQPQQIVDGFPILTKTIQLGV